MGRNAWPIENPRAEIDKARPRVATNHRAIATAAIWLIMPCPIRRNAKMTKGSNQSHGLIAIARQASANPRNANAPNVRTRKISACRPAQTITIAEAVVPIVYIAPQPPWLRPNSAWMSAAKSAMKKVCPKLDKQVKRTPALNHLALSRRYAVSEVTRCYKT